MRLGSVTARVRRELEQRRPPSCPDGWTTEPQSFVGVAFLGLDDADLVPGFDRTSWPNF